MAGGRDLDPLGAAAGEATEGPSVAAESAESAEAPDELEPEAHDDDSGSWVALGDGIKRAVVGGLAAALTAEEGIRHAVGEMRLPKEALNYIAQQTDRSRRELFRGVSKEVKAFLSSIDVVGEVRRAMVGMKLEVKAEVRFVDEQQRETKLEASVTEVGKAGASGKKVKPRRRKKT